MQKLERSYFEGRVRVGAGRWARRGGHKDSDFMEGDAGDTVGEIPKEAAWGGGAHVTGSMFSIWILCSMLQCGF